MCSGPRRASARRGPRGTEECIVSSVWRRVNVTKPPEEYMGSSREERKFLLDDLSQIWLKFCGSKEFW